jgi:hypothetical protein
LTKQAGDPGRCGGGDREQAEAQQFRCIERRAGAVMPYEHRVGGDRDYRTDQAGTDTGERGGHRHDADLQRRGIGNTGIGLVSGQRGERNRRYQDRAGDRAPFSSHGRNPCIPSM